jgi:hypothetical protein
MQNEEYMTAAEAMRALGVGNKKMMTLLALGEQGQPGGLPWVRDALDKRIKLVKRSDVEELQARSAKPKKEAA